jgi:hypothetical protein
MVLKIIIIKTHPLLLLLLWLSKNILMIVLLLIMVLKIIIIKTHPLLLLLLLLW